MFRSVYRIICLSTFVFLAACSTDKTPSLMTDLEAISNQKGLDSVATAVHAYLSENPDEDGGMWYNRLGEKAFQLSRTKDAERFYITGIRDFPESAERGANLLALADLYRGYMDQPLIANAIFCALNQHGDTEISEKAKTHCKPNDPGIDTLLIQTRQASFNPETGRVNLKEAQRYITMCKVRALISPEDAVCADHLNEAAKIAKAINDHRTALDLYDWIIEDYSDGPYGPKAMFLKAFTYENDLNDLESARTTYEAFLKRWPNDEFADDAKLLLDNLGKDPEELIKQFQQNKK